ncbi:hypothetical protein D3C71_1361310 [compost metagenome]
MNCLVKAVPGLLGSNGLATWSITSDLESRLIVDETLVVVFGARLDVSMRKSVSTPLMILPLASTP